VFDHVTLRVSDRKASERFYDTVLRTLGIDESYRTTTFSEWQGFSITVADQARPTTRRLHVAFGSPNRQQVDQFWEAGTSAGYADAGAPGPRPQYSEDYYGAFLLDPDGNRIEAVHHRGVRREGVIDHLWIRVADLAAAKTFYETIAPYAGLRLATDQADRVQFRTAGASFSLVPGTPTANVHVAFPTTDDGDVQRFHQAATAAGYVSDGPPGERPRYHPGYYAAYVLDADGNSIEVVNHHRS